MLIMVDDKTTRSGLLAKSAHPASEGNPRRPARSGFYRSRFKSGPARQRRLYQQRLHPSGGGPTAAPAAPAAAPVEVSLVSASRFACRTLVTILGPGGRRFDRSGREVQECRESHGQTGEMPRGDSGHGGQEEGRRILGRRHRPFAQGVICGKLGGVLRSIARPPVVTSPP